MRLKEYDLQRRIIITGSSGTNAAVNGTSSVKAGTSFMH